MKSEELKLDLSGIYDEETFHEYVSKLCGFPGFYGFNFDAFWDCISSSDLNTIPEKVRIEGLKDFAVNCPSGYKKLMPTLKDWIELNEREIQYEA